MIYAQILDIINQNVKQNGKEEITGNILNSVLRALLDFINSQNQSFNGVLTTQTKPNNITKGFWFANEGVYPYFGISVPENNLGVIYWDNGYKVDLIDLVDEQALKDYIDQQLVNVNLGFGGEITNLNQSPTIDGMYLPKIIGVYPNFGNLEYLASDGFVVFLYKDGVFSKVNIPLEITIEDDVNYNSNNTVSGSAVEKYAVKKVNTIADLRNTQGEYEGQIVELLGYYQPNDEAPSIKYKWSSDIGTDDGGKYINTSNGTWEALFNNEINILNYGAKSEDKNFDNSIILNKVLQENKHIYIPIGIFYVNNSIRLNNHNYINGEGNKSVLTSISNNSFNIIELINVSFCKIKHLSIEVNSKIQNGIISKCFECELDGIFTNNCNIAIELSGTNVILNKAWITNSNIGTNINDSGTGVHSTLISITNSNYQYNNLGVTNIQNGQSISTRNVINFKLENVVFEKNTKPFNLIPFSYSFNNVWIEGNSEKGSLMRYNGNLSNIRINSSEQEIDWIEGDRNYMGNIEDKGVGILSIKELQLQAYNNNGLNDNPIILKSDNYGRVTKNKRPNELINANKYISTFIENVNNENNILYEGFDQIGSFLIHQNGDFISKSSDAVKSCSKTGTGIYIIDFLPYLRPIINITAYNETQNNDYIYCTCNASLVGDANSYNYFSQISRITINVYKRVIDENGFLKDALVDGKIHGNFLV